jgi:hypothetical protein
MAYLAPLLDPSLTIHWDGALSILVTLATTLIRSLEGVVGLMGRNGGAQGML